MKMHWSIEYLTTNVYLCRLHEKDNEHIGDPYVASCVLHYIDHLPYVKGLVSNGIKPTPYLIKDLKKKAGTEYLYFERDNTHKERLRKV